MRGNSTLTKKIINKNAYAQRYTSGVLSWEEVPTSISNEKLDLVMDSFENMVSAGMDSDRLNWLWVMHQDKNRIELHYVIPNVDLQTGKRFAPYFDRVDRSRFRSWERYTNALYGFTDPSDPAKKRNLRLPSKLPKEKNEAIEYIHSAITKLVEMNMIKNREDVINQLVRAGYEINRKSEEYISIVDESGRKLRLRGRYYEAAFTNILAKPKNHKNSFDFNHIDQTVRLQLLRDTFIKEVKVREKYIQQRFSNSRQFSIHFESKSLDTKEVTKHDRSTEYSHSIVENTGAADIAARTITNKAIQRVESTITNVELTATKFSGKLTGITREFAKFINDCNHSIQRIIRKSHQSKSVNNLKIKY